MSQFTCHMSHVTFHLSLTPTITTKTTTVDWFQIQKKHALIKHGQKRVTINNPGYLRNYTRRPGYGGTIWMIS